MDWVSKQEIGSIQEGKQADMVLLAGNPLEDITNTRQIAGTMVRGKWYSKEDLDVMLSKISQNYEGYESRKTMFRILFWIAIGLFTIALLWFAYFQIKRLKNKS